MASFLRYAGSDCPKKILPTPKGCRASVIFVTIDLPRLLLHELGRRFIGPSIVMLNRIRLCLESLRVGEHAGPRIVFLHLPRTGGTALVKDIFFANFPRSRLCHVNYGADMQAIDGAHDPLAWPAWRRKRVGFLGGHMPFGFAKHFPGRSEYITLLRDPISRTVSDYHFCRNNPSNPAYEAATALSLREFVERGFASSRNCYARWLSNAVFGAKFHNQDEMLREALHNLAHFSVIGITELFDLSVARLCQKYGLAARAYSVDGRNAATPEARSMTPKELEVLREANTLDQVIYDECRRRFAGIDTAGPVESSA